MQLSHDDRLGLHLLVAYEELNEVCAYLSTRGVAFDEDPDASATCGGPVVGVLRFPEGADRAALQRVLDGFAGSS